MEHCKRCHETFNNTRAGDKHMVVESTYHAVINGKAAPEVSQRFRCLTAAEMLGIGMNQEKNGCWNGGGNWTPSILG